MRDKDIAALLARIEPLIDVWHCCDLPMPRAATAAELAALVQSAIEATTALRTAPSGVHRYGDPATALRAAAAAADPTDRIVVFGSFRTVGEVLRQGLPRLSAAHIG